MRFCLPNSCICRFDWPWLIDRIEFNPYIPCGILQQRGLVFNQPNKHLWHRSDSFTKLRFPLFIFGTQFIPQAMHPENNLPKTYVSCHLIKSIVCFIFGAAHRAQCYFGRLLNILNQSDPMKQKHLTEVKLWHKKSCFPIS